MCSSRFIHAHEHCEHCLFHAPEHCAAASKIMYEKLELEYEQRKKQEKADGGSGWATMRWKQDLLEKMSVAIAKGNRALLDAHTRVPVAPT